MDTQGKPFRRDWAHSGWCGHRQGKPFRTEITVNDDGGTEVFNREREDAENLLAKLVS